MPETFECEYGPGDTISSEQDGRDVAIYTKGRYDYLSIYLGPEAARAFAAQLLRAADAAEASMGDERDYIAENMVAVPTVS